MKKLISIVLILALVLSMTGCGGEAEETEATTEATEAATQQTVNPLAETAPADAFTVALVVAGQFGDGGVYDDARVGCEMLVSNYAVQLMTFECNGQGYSAQISKAAEQAHVVVLVGRELSDGETIARSFSDVKFVWVDNVTSAPVDNVLSIIYAQNEGSFLAGYVAAKMTETDVIGAVGSEDCAQVNDYILGYRQGAAYADEDVTVEVAYAGSRDDTAAGRDCALTLYKKGADVIYQIASKAGDGVFQAAQEKGFYAIGSDVDQKQFADEVILCSMVKEVGKSVYDAVGTYLDGDDTLWGTTWLAGVDGGYVGLSYGGDDATEQVEKKVRKNVDKLIDKITDGDIVVDTTR